MADVKLTKNELRDQQNKLSQLLRYLPTLQLKKSLLQQEVFDARLEKDEHESEYSKRKDDVFQFAALFSEHLYIDISPYIKPKEVTKRYENIAGAEVPYLESCTFEPLEYDLFETPAWLEGALLFLQQMQKALIALDIAKEKLHILEKELREVSIRVNLFEKILIPRCENNIRKIKVFLGDVQLAAVCQAKVAKRKIEEHKLFSELQGAKHAL